MEYYSKKNEKENLIYNLQKKYIKYKILESIDTIFFMKNNFDLIFYQSNDLNLT